MTDESKLSKRYRELAREEPPRALDDAILARSRRAVEARPAPLVVPTGRRRWYFPLAAAAIIVLAVAVTIHVERQQPDAEAVMQADTAAPPAPTEKQTLPAQSPAASAPQAASKPAPPQGGAKREQYAPDPKPVPPPLADLQKAPSAPPPSARESELRRKDATDALASRRDEASPPQPQSAPAPGAARARVQQSVPAPEQWLQGIADLRRQGRHEEADKALAEFRRTYPDYRISEAILEKVEKR
jgi:hypothetical protein